MILLIKVLFVIALFGVIYYQLFVHNDIHSLVDQVRKSTSIQGGFVLIVLSILLMPINWGIEGYKWKKLVSIFQEISYSDAIKSVLSGVSLAIMTPARIGEYGGRLVNIRPEHRSKAILANLISSISQNIVSIGLGSIFIILFINHFLVIEANVFIALSCMIIIVICALLTLYFRFSLIGGLLNYLPNHRFILKVRKSVSAFEHVETKMLLNVLVLSCIRYGVYLSQYVILLFFYGVTDQLGLAIIGVGTIFFLQSNLPLPPVLSVLARGEMAIFLWSYFTDNVLGILAATFTLWIINLVIPAILGASQVVLGRTDLR